MQTVINKEIESAIFQHTLLKEIRTIVANIYEKQLFTFRQIAETN